MELPDADRDSIKEYVRKWSRDEAAKAEMTVSPASTVQPCMSYSPDPDFPSEEVCVILKDGESEGTMSPALKKQQPSSADTGIRSPRQQCTPERGTWEEERIIASDNLHVGMNSTQEGDNPLYLEHVYT